MTDYAIIARPLTPEVDDPNVGSVNLEWEGQRMERAGTVTMDDPFVPSVLGQLLVDTYWSLEANIEHWWQHFVLARITPPTRDSGTARWVYVGTARFLIVFHYDGTRWLVGKVPWSEPADALTLQPL